MLHILDKKYIVTFLIYCTSVCYAGEQTCEAVSVTGKLIPKCTTELSLLLGKHGLIAPEKTAYYPVLLELDGNDISLLPKERSRFLSIESYVLAYLTSEEIINLSTHPNVLCMGLGGDPVKTSERIKKHLWPRVIKVEEPETPVNVLLAIIDINIRALKAFDNKISERLLLQCESVMLDTKVRSHDVTSVHGANMVAVCSKFAPNSCLAIYDSNFEKFDIFIGLETIYDYVKPLGIPAIVNLSASCHVGSHDGLSLWERALGCYHDKKLYIVTSSGNTFDSDVHIFLTKNSLDKRHTVEIPFVMHDTENDSATCELGLWFKGHAPTKYQLYGLTKNAIENAPHTQCHYMNHEIEIAMAYQSKSNKGNDAHITLALRFNEIHKEKQFKVLLSFDDRLEGDMQCDGWLTSVPARLLSCKAFSKKTGTIESFSCARGVISVGTISNNHGGRVFQGVGPTRDGRVKPDIFVKTSLSTSYATAVVSGLITQVLQRRVVDEPKKALLYLSEQYKWLVLPEVVYDK